MRRKLVGRMAVAAAVAVGVTTTSAGAAGTPAASPKLQGHLNAVDSVSADNAWAVGSTPDGDIDLEALAFHWNGRSWTRVSTPAPAVNWSDSLAAVSGKWAVGAASNTSNFTDKALILHRVGHHWVNWPTSFAAPLLDVNGDWAVGDESKSAAILHWNGRQWVAVHTPALDAPGAYLNSVSGHWAAGADQYGALMLHWNGKRWTRVTLPKLGNGAVLTGVDGNWAVGDATENKWSYGTGAVTLHWNGQHWVRVAVPHAAKGADLSGISGNEAVASKPTHTITMHWTGSRWQVTSIRNPPKAVKSSFKITIYDTELNAVSGPWAVGDYTTSRNKQPDYPLILRRSGRSWKRSMS